MPFVQAKCPNCGGMLAVDSTHDAAVCQFCNTPFIVEKAINNYNISISGNVNIDSANITISNGPTVSNYLERAKRYFDSKEYEIALEYVNKILDIDANNCDALKYQSILCGTPERSNLIIHRNSYFTGSIRNFYVTLDGKEVGHVGNGGSLSLIIKAGKHQIFGKIANITTNVETFFLTTSMNSAIVEITCRQGFSSVTWNLSVSIR